MLASRAMPSAPSRSRPVALLLGSCALAAVGTAWAVWSLFPYERLALFSAEQRFLAWEGIIWLIALALGLLGLASVFQVVGHHLREGSEELGRRLRASPSEGQLLAAADVLPWWMLGYGLFLVVIATAARLLAAP
jgi:hypothetical protein